MTKTTIAKTFRVQRDGDYAALTFSTLPHALDFIRKGSPGAWFTLTTSDGKVARFVNGRLFGKVQAEA